MAKKKSDNKESLIDLSKHENPNYNQMLGTNGILTSIKVSKPSKETWFRCHPTEHVGLFIAEIPVRGSLKKKNFLVQGETMALHQELLSTLDVTRSCCCHLVATSTNAMMIWPRKLHTGEGDALESHTTAEEAFKASVDGFIKMKWNGGGYSWVSPRDPSIFKDPVWPEEQSIVDLCNLAFKGQIIKDMDHPAVLQADGRAL